MAGRRHAGTEAFFRQLSTVEGGMLPSLAAMGRTPPNFLKTLDKIWKTPRCD